jgi:hypothetical protein
LLDGGAAIGIGHELPFAFAVGKADALDDLRFRAGFASGEFPIRTRTQDRRQRLAAAPVEVRAASAPLPIFSGTGRMPCALLSASATNTRISAGSANALTPASRSSSAFIAPRSSGMT